MSWKGLTKAVARLPQLVMTRAGYAEGTQDPEFTEIEENFKLFDANARKLHEDAKKFKDSLSLMLAHQESFASTLKEVYEPIVAPTYSPSAASASGASPVSPDYQRPSLNSSSKSIPKETPQVSLQAAEAFAEFSRRAREYLLPDLEVIERRVVAPTAELVLLLDSVKRVIVKRSHKLLDYDRHRESVKKLREKPDRSISDEKSLGRYEAAFDQASRDYNHINNLLKQQIPALLRLKAPFIDPCFQTLYWYQLKVHRVLVDGYRNVIHQPLFDSRVSAAAGFEAKAEAQTALFDDLTLLAKNRKTLSGGTAALYDGAEYADDGYQTASAEVSPVDGSKQLSPGYAPPPDYESTGGGGGGAFSFAGMHQSLAPSPWADEGASAASPGVSNRAGAAKYVVALYDYSSETEGDLSFHRDDKIELINKTEDANDWWTGRLRGTTGIFPGNYVAEL
ncbi:hypothetical protein DFJ73DRAFT_480677 [Zopfochytrium polystomum]|nr:hypothetical protein DFJ73DRAFT_480677 [Zopfochytrium polystomum]